MRRIRGLLLSRGEAAKRLGRSHLTVRDWEIHGHLRVAKRDEAGRALYDARDLLACARRMQQNYLGRSITPGTGRGKRHPATQEIRRSLMAGESTQAIADALGCSESTVRRNRRELAAQDAAQAPKTISEGEDTGNAI